MQNKRSLLYVILLITLLFLPQNSLARSKDKSVNESDVNRFYDSLMELVSYDKYRDFYDSYIEENEISYDRFVKEIKERGIGISGGYDSKLIGWHRKGKKINLTIESRYNGSEKRVQLVLEEKKEGLKISAKEFFKKICEQKKKEARRKR